MKLIQLHDSNEWIKCELLVSIDSAGSIKNDNEAPIRRQMALRFFVPTKQ